MKCTCGEPLTPRVMHRTDGRINTPPLTMEIRRDLDCISHLPHNALADAFAIRAKHLVLEEG